jgi:hypothetical protein
MAKEDVEIRINLTSNAAGGTAVVNSLGKVKSQSEDTKRAMTALANATNSWGLAFKNAFAVNAVAGGFARAADMFGLNSLIERGTQFNAVMASTQSAIAGMLRSSQPERFATMRAALDASAGAMGGLREEARRARVSYQGLLAAFQLAAPFMSRNGVAVEQQVKLLADFARVTAAGGQEMAAFGQDFARLFQGQRGKRNLAADWLGLSTEQVKEAFEAGNLRTLIEERVAGLRDLAAPEGAAVAVTRAKTVLEDSLDEAAGHLAGAANKQIAQGYLDLAEAIRAVPVETLQSIGTSVGWLAKQGMSLVEFGVQNAKTLEHLARAAGVAALVFGGQKLLGALGSMVRNLGTFVQGANGAARALDDETAALGRNSSAQAANATARKGNAATVIKTEHGTAKVGAKTGFWAGLTFNRRREIGKVTKEEGEARAQFKGMAKGHFAAKRVAVETQAQAAEVEAQARVARERAVALSAMSVSGAATASRLGQRAAGASGAQADMLAARAATARTLADKMAERAAQAKAKADVLGAAATQARAHAERAGMRAVAAEQGARALLTEAQIARARKLNAQSALDGAGILGEARGAGKLARVTRGVNVAMMGFMAAEVGWSIGAPIGEAISDKMAERNTRENTKRSAWESESEMIYIKTFTKNYRRRRVFRI